MKLGKNVPSVEGARSPSNSRPVPPARSKSRSSIESAPASIPASTHRTFVAPFGDGTVKPSSSPSSPAASASRNSGTRPAADTKFGSSNSGRTV